MNTYIVTFFNMAGESIGSVEVKASTNSKAKVLASTIYTCSWVSQTAVPRVSGFLTWQFAFTTNTKPKGARPATANTSKRRGLRNWPWRRVSADTAKQQSARLTPAQKADKARKSCFVGGVVYG